MMKSSSVDLLRDCPRAIAMKYTHQYDMAVDKNERIGAQKELDNKLEEMDSLIVNLRFMLHWAVVARTGCVLEFIKVEKRDTEKPKNHTISAACLELYKHCRSPMELNAISQEVKKWSTTYQLWKKYPKLCLTQVPSGSCWTRQAGNIMRMLDREPMKAKMWMVDAKAEQPKLPRHMRLMIERDEERRHREDEEHAAKRRRTDADAGQNHG